MFRLKTEASFMPLAALRGTDSSDTATVLFHNVRSLHLHIDDVRSDFYIKKADINILVETKLCRTDTDCLYNLTGYTLHRNDYSQCNTRTCYETTVYIKKNIKCSEIPYRFNVNNVEITIMVINHPIPNLLIIGIYRSGTNVTVSKLIDALIYLHDSKLSKPLVPAVILSDFNINLMKVSGEQNALTKCLIDERRYTQLVNQCTTDSHTQIDHIYTNIPQLVQSAGTLESYYSDHKPIFISLSAS